MIKVTYYLKGKYFDHLQFSHAHIAESFIKELYKRGAENVRIFWI